MSRPIPLARPKTDAVQLEQCEQPTWLRLGHERSLLVERSADDVRLHIRSGESDAGPRSLEIEVRFTDEGPTLRVRAHRVELEAATHIAARCETFVVEARERIELRSQGAILQHAEQEARVQARRIDLEATPGAVRIKANDEVQLLGEAILLNCDKPKPQPAWVQQYLFDAPATVPISAHSGDADVIRALLDDE